MPVTRRSEYLPTSIPVQQPQPPATASESSNEQNGVLQRLLSSAGLGGLGGASRLQLSISTPRAAGESQNSGAAPAGEHGTAAAGGEQPPGGLALAVEGGLEAALQPSAAEEAERHRLLTPTIDVRQLAASLERGLPFGLLLALLFVAEHAVGEFLGVVQRGAGLGAAHAKPAQRLPGLIGAHGCERVCARTRRSHAAGSLAPTSHGPLCATPRRAGLCSFAVLSYVLYRLNAVIRGQVALKSQLQAAPLRGVAGVVLALVPLALLLTGRQRVYAHVVLLGGPSMPVQVRREVGGLRGAAGQLWSCMRLGAWLWLGIHVAPPGTPPGATKAVGPSRPPAPLRSSGTCCSRWSWATQLCGMPQSWPRCGGLVMTRCSWRPMG